MRHQKEKGNLHPNNKHRLGYDFPVLIQASPELRKFVHINRYGNDSIDFADQLAVKALNKALLVHYYSVEHWDIPKGFLCPPVPGRVDYIHYIADLLNVKTKKHTRCLDIGTGVNCIYPILGVSEYNWSFVATDVDTDAIESAKTIVCSNNILKDHVEIRTQENKQNILKGIIHSTDIFDAVICNPPFHSSLEESMKGTTRKVKNLNRKKGLKKTDVTLNFEGQANELCYEGGEVGFISKYIKESRTYASQCSWFTTLVSKESNLNYLKKLLHVAKQIKVIKMSQGNKVSRILAWSFVD